MGCCRVTSQSLSCRCRRRRYFRRPSSSSSCPCSAFRSTSSWSVSLFARLLVVFLVCSMPSPSTSAPPIGPAGFARVLPADESEVRYRTETHLRLMARCSRHYVQITTDVYAGDAHSNLYADLVLLSEGFGKVLIQSRNSQGYLCFNKNGKMVVKDERFVNPKRGRVPRQCVFHEKHTGSYLEYQSTQNATWYVGFNRDGVGLKGSFWARRPRSTQCRQFTKLVYKSAQPAGSIGRGHPPSMSLDERILRRLRTSTAAATTTTKIARTAKPTSSTTTSTTTPPPPSERPHRRRHHSRSRPPRQQQQQQLSDQST